MSNKDKFENIEDNEEEVITFGDDTEDLENITDETEVELVKLKMKDLKREAHNFCKVQEKVPVPKLYGVSDGKAVGTYIEHQFKEHLARKYTYIEGNSANGIDLPGKDIVTDIKVTSSKQPQSSSPFKSARQKIYGLGHNLLLFVYDKFDDPKTSSAYFSFTNCTFIDKDRTADFQATTQVNTIMEHNGNIDDIFAFFEDRRIPGDEITLTQLAEEILDNPPSIGYLTISNALQWRLQYGRVVNLKEVIKGIEKIV